jgi:serine/threonine-protein kinase
VEQSDDDLLPAVDGTSTLWVDSEPVGAGVLVDGDSVGVTPLLVPTVAAGQHTVTVRAPGYARRDTVLLVEADLPAQVWVALQPSSSSLSTTAPGGTADPPPTQPPPPAPPPAPEATEPAPEAPTRTGRVEIAARPWGDIYIDGTLVRSQSDVLYQAELPTGRHRVRVSHPTLGSQERTITVAPGGAQRLTFDLGPTADSAPE